MSNLDKLALNNQIVLMRHDVKRAKCCTINKLVKEIRKLENKKGTEEQLNKNVRKRNRLIEILKIIKKLKDDDVSKFLLGNTENLSSVLNNAEKDLKLKAIAKVCMNNFLKTALFDFKKKYPQWEEEVPILLPQLGKKVPKKMKQISVKEKIIKEKDKNDVLDHPICDNQVIIKTSGNNGFLVQNTKRKFQVSERTNKIVKGNKKNKLDFASENFLLENDVSLNNNNTLLSEITTKDKDFRSKVSKKNEQKTRNEKMRVVDPFFMTLDNSEYVTLATSEKQIEALNNSEPSRNNFSSNKDLLKNFDDFRNKVKNVTYHNSDYRNKKPSPDSRNGMKLNLKKIGNGLKFESNNIIPDEKLHPSWEAKKKQLGLKEFSGKKIIFSDD